MSLIFHLWGKATGPTVSLVMVTLWYAQRDFERIWFSLAWFGLAILNIYIKIQQVRDPLWIIYGGQTIGEVKSAVQQSSSTNQLKYE